MRVKRWMGLFLGLASTGALGALPVPHGLAGAVPCAMRHSIESPHRLDSNARVLQPGERNTIDVVKRVSPSVAAITVFGPANSIGALQPLSPKLRGFFERLGPLNPLSQSVTATRLASGSGFVIDQVGRILTDYQLVAGALRVHSLNFRSKGGILIRFPDNREPHAATVIGIDEGNGLALLALIRSASSSPQRNALPLADSDHVRVGETAIVIGNPFALQSTVTQGTVSAVRRAPAAHAAGGYIQVDAAVGPGSAGGPLLNSCGEVIGVSEPSLSPSGLFAGMARAIPSNVVRRSLQRMGEGER